MPSRTKYKTREDRETETERKVRDRTYFSAGSFLLRFRTDALCENFILEESVFVELYGIIQADVSLAREICDAGAMLVLTADSGFEFNAIMEMAQVIAEENDG